MATPGEEAAASRWREYIIPTLLSAAVALGAWSVTQHFIIRAHDQEQEMRLQQIEYRLDLLEKGVPATARLHEQVAAVDVTTKLMLEELKRVRDRLERLEARR